MTRIVYMGSHAILDHDELKLLTSLGHDVFSLTGYITPSDPHEKKRGPVPEAKDHPELKAHVDALNTPDNLGAAKERLPDAILDWAEVIICAAYEWKWLAPQWSRLRDKRVVWRTIGQSLEPNERLMAPLFEQGLEIVRYSPKERSIPGFAGETTVIRFAKDPAEWQGWTGDWAALETPQGIVVGPDRGPEHPLVRRGVPFVTNFTQHLAQRGAATNYTFWQEAASGLPAVPAGPGSEAIDGLGTLAYEQMQAVLRGARCYLYTGTQPASYTLGLIEALMTGTPTVSIGPAWMEHPDLFEGHELAGMWTNEPARANIMLRDLLSSEALSRAVSKAQRAKAIDLFGIEGRMAEWSAFLGGL